MHACFVNQQRFHRTAHAVTPRLGVVADTHGFFDVGMLVNVHVTVTVEMFDYWYGGLRGDALNQAFAAAWNDHVNVFGERDHLADGGAVGGLNDLHNGLGQLRRF